MKTDYDGMKNQQKTFPMMLSNLLNLIVAGLIIQFSGKGFRAKMLTDRNSGLSAILMFMGLRLAYESMFDLPYLLHILMRSTKAVSYTLGAFFIERFFTNEKRVTRNDILLMTFISSGLIVFNLDDGKKNSKDYTFLPVMISLLGLVVESIASFFQQKVKENHKPNGFEFMFMNSMYVFFMSVVNCK